MEKEIILMPAAIILGGGVNDDGSLPTHVKTRLEMASTRDKTYSFIIFSSRYTLNKPPVIDSDGFIVTEASTMAKEYLLKYNFTGQVFLELYSTDTIGSALSCRSLIENIDVSVDEIDIITSDWHTERSKAIFEWAFSLEGPNNSLPLLNHRVAITSGSIPAERTFRERRSLAHFKKYWLPITKKSDAWLCLLKQHDNYNFHNNSKFRGNYNYLY